MQSMLFDRLRPIGFSPSLAASFDALGLAQAWPARVTEVQRETATLDDGDASLPARVHPHLARALADSADAIAVGDWVAAARDAHGAAWVQALLPAATRIIRLDSSGRRRVLVSNVEVALIVMGLDGDFNPRRPSATCADAGRRRVALIVLTKLDCATQPRQAIDELRRRIPAPCRSRRSTPRRPRRPPRSRRTWRPDRQRCCWARPAPASRH